MKKLKVEYCIVFIFLLVLGGAFFMYNVSESKIIVKEAIKRNQISTTDYILCQRARVTGFDWLIIQDEEGRKSKEFGNILGPNPFEDFEFKHEFVMAKNTFIFYIEEKNVYYSEEMKMDVVEYTVTGWDILYPIRRELPDIFISSKYIVENDLRKD